MIYYSLYTIYVIALCVGDSNLACYIMIYV